MTRKEPRLSDDYQLPTSNAVPTYEAPRQTAAPSAPPVIRRTPWLLWLFTLVSLTVSAGIALFALQEGGQYQAELRSAREQAKALSEQLRLVTETQSVATGELALSDQQTRQAVIAAEGRIKQEFGLRLNQADSAVKQLKTDLDTLKGSLRQADTSIKRLQTRNEALQSELNAAKTELSALKGTQAGLEQRLSSEIGGLAGAQQLLADAQNSLTDSVGLVRSELLTERDRISGLVADRKRFDDLERGLTESALADARLEREIQLVRQQFDAVTRLERTLERLDQRVAILSEPNPALMTIDVLGEQVDRLGREQRAQQVVIESIEATRKQLTQRLIDLDSRLIQLSTRAAP